MWMARTFMLHVSIRWTERGVDDIYLPCLMRSEERRVDAFVGLFTAEEFREDCKEKNQKQSFSEVGAQHQNAKA